VAGEEPTPRQALHSPGAPSGRALLAIIFVVLVLAYLLRYVLLPFLIAAAIAYVVRPISRRLRERLHLPRIVAGLVVYFVVVGLLAAAGWWFAGSIATTVADAASQAPEILARLIRELFGPQLQVFGQSLDPEAAAEQILGEARRWLLTPSEIMTAGTFALALPVASILVFVLLFYFLLSGHRLADGALWLIPPAHRARVHAIAHRVDPVMRRYAIGVVVIVTYTASIAWLVLGLVFHLPYAALLSILVGVLELIPIIGPAISIALIGVSALQQEGGLWLIIGFMAFAIGLRVSIDQVVAPLVLGRAVTVHPVVVMFSFLVGATLFGILGILLAVPAAATIKVVLAAVYEDPEEE